MPDVKATPPATDFDLEARLYIFDIGGNTYRLTASLSFGTQSVLIDAVMTHTEHIRNG